MIFILLEDYNFNCLVNDKDYYDYLSFKRKNIYNVKNLMDIKIINLKKINAYATSPIGGNFVYFST